MPLLEIRNLQIEFGAGARAARAVDGVSLALEAGRTLGLVGESGSGKSVTALSMARLVPSPPARYVGGEILLEGRDVLKMSGREHRLMLPEIGFDLEESGVIAGQLLDDEMRPEPLFLHIARRRDEDAKPWTHLVDRGVSTEIVPHAQMRIRKLSLADGPRRRCLDGNRVPK